MRYREISRRLRASSIGVYVPPYEGPDTREQRLKREILGTIAYIFDSIAEDELRDQFARSEGTNPDLCRVSDNSADSDCPSCSP